MLCAAFCPVGRALRQRSRIRRGIGMLNPALRQVYLVKLYNKVVRALVKENQSHLFYADHWADTHTQDVVAMSEDEARTKIAKRFPPEDGFVIETVMTAAH